MNKSIKKLCIISMIAAIYTVVSLLLAPFSFGNIQVRIAEALTMLPLIYFPSVYGVTLGCFLTNLVGVFTGANILGVLDVFLGTFATVVAALLTYRFRNVKIFNLPLLSMLMPVILNGIIVGAELGYVLFEGNILFGSLISGLEVAVGEMISVVMGIFLVRALGKTRIFE